MDDMDYWADIPHKTHVNLCRRLPQPEDVEDVEQEIRMELWKRRSSFRKQASPASLRYKIQQWKIGDFYRRLYRRREAESMYLALKVSCISSQSSQRSVNMAIDILLRGISPANAFIFRKHIQGYSFEEIAAYMGTTYDAVECRWKRTVSKLRTEIGSGEVYMPRFRSVGNPQYRK